MALMYVCTLKGGGKGQTSDTLHAHYMQNGEGCRNSILIVYCMQRGEWASKKHVDLSRKLI